MSDFNLGTVTAYGYAKDKGYTGTEDEYAELMASYADVAEQAAESAEQAAASATTATAKASEAAQSATAAASSKTAAETAQGGAETAAQTATTKAGEATTAATTATNKATEATTAATTATGKATEAAGSATTATTKAGEASTSATNAAASATRAQEILDSIPEDYSQMSEDVADLKDGLSDVEAQVTAALVTDTASGAIASFPDGADGVPVKSLTVDIEPVQSGSGDPSPTNIRPISGHTSAVVTRCGKNLLNPQNVLNNYYIDGNTKKITSISGANVFYLSVTKNTTLNVSSDKGNRTAVAGYYKEPQTIADSVADTLIINSATQNLSFNFNTGECEFIAIYLNRDQTNKPTWVQVEVGSTATTYEPYTAQTVTIDLDGTRYGGTLNATTGVLTVDRTIVDLGMLNWSNNGADSVYASISGKASTENAISDTMAKVASSTTVSNMPDWSFKSISGGNRVAVKVSGITVQNASTMLSGVHLCYEMSEPFEVTLTGQDLTTVKGQNNIWADTGDVEVEYRADTKLYIEKLTAPTEDDMIADHAISANTFFMIGNTLYRATTAIASGATITVGTNATRLSLSDALNTLS